MLMLMRKMIPAHGDVSSPLPTGAIAGCRCGLQSSRLTAKSVKRTDAGTDDGTGHDPRPGMIEADEAGNDSFTGAI